MLKLKTKEEIEYIRSACNIVKNALGIAERMIKPGVATIDIDSAVEKYIIENKAVPSFKNYNGFNYSTCISLNDEVVHGVPGNKILKEGDIVSIDIGACINGYHGDAARTFPVGKISSEDKRLIDVTKECFYKGISQIKIGNTIGDVSSNIQKHAENNGFSIIRELVGHGIGKELHEDPQVPNYGLPGEGEKILNGLCIAVEPMLSYGNRNIKTDNDGWTIRTVDGSKTAHYENTVIIINGEVEILTL